MLRKTGNQTHILSAYSGIYRDIHDTLESVLKIKASDHLTHKKKKKKKG